MPRLNITEVQPCLATPNFDTLRSISPLAPQLLGPPRLHFKKSDCRYREHHLDLSLGRVMLGPYATADNRSADPRTSQGTFRMYMREAIYDTAVLICSVHITQGERIRCRSTARTYTIMHEAGSITASRWYTFLHFIHHRSYDDGTANASGNQLLWR